MSKLEFWYDFASTYSYLTAMRIDRIADESGVDVVWRPFLLGPIFKAQGWATSPFNVYPAKGRYMIRDIERIAAARGIGFVMPRAFPAPSLSAARIALATGDVDWTRTFSRTVFDAEFGRGDDISDIGVLRRLVAESGVGSDADALIEKSRSTEVKEMLRIQTSRAVDLGIFGAPTLVTRDGELFWGDDRAEQAIRWAQVL